MPKHCEYCGSKALLVKGDYIYPHRKDLASKNFYYCAFGHDAAYVGCHKGTKKPLGRLADYELRKAKQEAHAAFDPKWKSGAMTRRAAYKRLAERLGIKVNDCHIGMFDIETCKKVVNVCT